MNPKNSGSKKARKGLKIEPNHGGAEIFVLPPQLLQKLGINLTNIVISQEATSNNTIGNGNIFCTVISFCLYFTLWFRYVIFTCSLKKHVIVDAIRVKYNRKQFNIV